MAFYYYLALLNAVVSLAVAIAVFWRNRYQLAGPVFSLAMLVGVGWQICFAQYFQPLETAKALFWAKVTLSAAIANHPFYFHSVCLLVDKAKRMKWWIAISYATGFFFLILLWQGSLVTGLKYPPELQFPMHHYVHYNRTWYPFLMLHLGGWEMLGMGVLIHGARQAVGYKRTQLFYFTIAWLIVFLSTTSIIAPIEYGLDIPPFGFFVMPLNMAFVAYALGKARLADFNLVITRILLHTVTLLIIVVASLLFIGGMTLVAPGFMNQQQVLFTVALVVTIGLGMAATFPRMLPQLERIMQQQLLGTRYSYQDTLSGLVRELSHLSNLDEVLGTVVSEVHTEMQVTRALILMRSPLSGQFELLAESGMSGQEKADPVVLAGDSAIIHWLEDNDEVLVRDELPRRTDAESWRKLEAELNRVRASLCVPMTSDRQLTGVFCLGDKLNRSMFFDNDIKLLETLATEMALAAKYRRLDEEIARKNKLIELGTIAAGVAHEIRNPLASIRTFAQLLPDKVDDPEFKNEFSKLVVKDVERITRVVETMLAFARPGQVAIAEHPVTDLVEDAVLLVQPRLKNKQINILKQIHARPVIKVDKQQMLQVLINLLNNAIDVLPPGGEIRVVAGVNDAAALQAGHDHQKTAVIEVSDNGPGIPSVVRSRIFDPFFTTKKDGTGLGLSISQKIVRDHGGILSVSSIEGKGTTFQISLPLS